jgi:fibronectin type 3 domain-containing protein
VTGTGVVQDPQNVELSWNADGTAVGYNVYRSNAKAGPFEQINNALDASTNYTDDTVVAGATYYYATNAVNAQGDQSGYSNIVEAVVPDR